MTREEFVRTAAYITAACGKPLAPASVEVYYDLLGDLPANVFETAAKRVCLEHVWATFPSAAELRAAASETMRGIMTELSPAEAWKKAWSAIGAIDPEVEGSKERVLKVLPPLVVEAMQAYGIFALCYGKEPITIVRAQFVKIYEQLAARDRRLGLLPPAVRQSIEKEQGELPGAVRSIAGRIGHEVSRPVPVDPETDAAEFEPPF